MGNGIIKNESVGARTQDLRLKRALLYQLSYTPETGRGGKILPTTGAKTRTLHSTVVICKKINDKNTIFRHKDSRRTIKHHGIKYFICRHIFPVSPDKD